MLKRTLKISSVFLLLLTTCSSPDAVVEAKKKDTQQIRWLSQVNEEARQKTLSAEQATAFDRFLRNELEAHEKVMLEDSCVGAPEKNVFCFSVINFDYFDDKHNKSLSPQRRRRRGRRVRPRYNKKGRLINWKQLKFASVGRMISPVAGLSQARLHRLKRRILKDKTCPLNVAIAVAAALEDHLPKKSKANEIGALYEKGADCLSRQRGDRAALLTRAGLFYYLEKDYKKAYEIFTRASEIKDIVNSRPLYWKHRTELALKKEKEAQETLENLESVYPFAFHTVVAKTTSQADPGIILEQPHTKVKRSQEVPTINLLIEQVEILNSFGFEDSARTVLDWAVMESDGVEPEVKIYLAELKHKEGDDHLDKIKLLANVLLDNPHLISKRAMEFYFPKPFFPIFEKHSSGIDPYLLLAIARQESAFNPKAVSPANAYGLLQVIPTTGRRVSNASRKDLLTPERNIETGAKYFQILLKSLGGQIHLAMAAYNAGPNKLKEWLRRYPTDDPILFIDVIPYRETRNYVGLVLRNYYWYRRMHGKNPDPAEVSRRVLKLKQLE